MGGVHADFFLRPAQLDSHEANRALNVILNGGFGELADFAQFRVLGPARGWELVFVSSRLVARSS